MKFQLKALAAAAILAASIPAQASLELPNTGDGSTVLVVIDRTANLTATFDLGFHYSDFNQIAAEGPLGAAASSNQSWDLANSANYSATWAALFANGATLPNLTYAFLAADNLGPFATPASQGFISTFVTTGGSTASTPVVTAAGQFNTTLGNIDFVNTLQSNLNTSATNGAALNSGVSGVYNVSGKLNNIGNIIFGNVGDSLAFSQYVTGATGITAAPNINGANFANNAHIQLLSNGLLSYTVAAVPEANTWGMMLLGLGFMGFVARRKQA